ncbi:hypothetical protein LY28_01426 [Ruminiclostridium sufflavum DSM 19573]|uniref:Uncharacterized protein n=1 Tax=Ruminiclostridium sufflavum DSM 19573 TaxID=1121337 RepID=A0A318XQT1_9FIRM|nr:hypothetical protein [Ruminiclostridium sufflavum]PYG88575.1 hypothetical protein LY28_01426 [Ruminiclostridium sufflavum DSM 19573]
MRKLYLSILYVLLLSLVISGAILLSKPSEKNRAAGNIGNIGASYIKNSLYISRELKKEEIEVVNNSPDIDLHAYLAEDKYGRVSLNLTYSLSGRRIIKKIDKSSLPEIRNMFSFRELSGEGYRLYSMILNKNMKKLYFYAERKKDKKYTHTTVYSYNMENSQIEKIIYGYGEFSKFFISPEGEYNAFSYKVCPLNISGNEKTVTIIISCSNDKIVFNSDADSVRKPIGTTGNFYVYSYDFIGWRLNSICELNQQIRAKDNQRNMIKSTVKYNLNGKTSNSGK